VGKIDFLGLRTLKTIYCLIIFIHLAILIENDYNKDVDSNRTKNYNGILN